MGNIQGNIRILLEEGYSPTKIKRKLNLSRKTIWKHTQILLRNGLIQKVARGVYRKAVKPEMLPTLKPVADVTTPPIMLPHKFGAIFKQNKKPALPYDEWGKAYEKVPNYYTAQFGKHKTQIWLYSGYSGNTVNEIINSGRKQITAIAEKLSIKYGISLTWDRWYEDIEWVDIDKTRSKATARGAGIRKGELVEVAGVLHKYDRHSQDGHMEFNQAPGHEAYLPTEHAKVREYIYSGKLAEDLYALMEGMKQIKMRMDLEAKNRK